MGFWLGGEDLQVFISNFMYVFTCKDVRMTYTFAGISCHHRMISVPHRSFL